MTEPTDANTGEAEASQEADAASCGRRRLRGSATAGASGT